MTFQLTVFRFKEFATDLFYNKATFFILLIFASVAITLQNILSGTHHFWGGNYTHYNNYLIFKYSFYHLIDNKNIYSYYLSEHADLFKYSPTFAFLMGIFAFLPDSAGLLCWNLLNVLVLYFSIISIKHIQLRNANFILLFILLELILSVQYSQSNALLTGLIIMAFNYLEKDKSEFATLFIVLASFIKVFSIASCLLLLLYPKKVKSFSYLIFWFVILGALPLLAIDFKHLYVQYSNWGQSLMNDHAESLGMSIYHLTSTLFPVFSNKITVLFLGLLVLITPLTLVRKYLNPTFRISYLGLLLIWMVVFNHKAESPSFIIAMTGCAIWGLHSEITKGKILLLTITFVLTSLLHTDLVPISIKNILPGIHLIKPFMSVIMLFFILFYFFKIKNQPVIPG